jgi:hypothetical protein
MRVLAFVMTMVAGMANISCDQLNKKDMKHMRSHIDHSTAYACPMHPDVTGHKGDKCPKCGMSLEKVAEANITMKLGTNPGRVDAGKEVELSFTPKDNSDSAVVVELQETHEKLIHVIAVNEDLTWFDHIHAEPDNTGAYKVRETFPTPGKYLVYADYKSSVGGPQTDRLEVNVLGNKNVSSQHQHQPKTKTETDGFSLSIQNGSNLNTGSVSLPIVLEKNGKKVQREDIEDYLGAVAHIILINQDDKDFVHIHPESSEISPIHGHADINKPCLYRMWVQFQTNGKVHTADFTLDFKQGEKTIEAGHKHSHAAEHKHQQCPPDTNESEVMILKGCSLKHPFLFSRYRHYCEGSSIYKCK